MQTNLAYQIERIITIRLEGDTPPELDLPQIETCAKSAELFKESLSPFSKKNVVIQDILDFREFCTQEKVNSFTVIYFVGHGWTNDQGYFCVSIKHGTSSKILTGIELATYIEKWVAPDAPLILFVDTCEAEKLKNAIINLKNRSVTAIFASRIDERAWNLRLDGVTQFALKLFEVLSKVQQTIGCVRLAESIAESIDRERLTNHQHVNYWVQGDSVLLSRYTIDELTSRRNRTARRIKNLLIATGLAVAGVIFVVGIHWYSHVFITIDLGNVNQLTNSATIKVFLQNPEKNHSEKIDSFSVSTETSIRRILPAKNLVIIFEASYIDKQPRAVNFHHVYSPSLFGQKSHKLVLPSSEEIAERVGMAYVSVSYWLQGEAQHPRAQLKPFWIDITPPTVSEYFPFIYELYKQGKIKVYESMLISNLFQNSDLSDEDIQQSLSATEFLAKSKIDEDFLLACLDCPAPMTPVEVLVYFKSLGKRLPSREEWEVSVRGVDGRKYPWGNRENNNLINAGLPQGIGSHYMSKLRPVLQHPKAISPFGLIDTVGNAGDWVEDKASGLGFMGGEFKKNLEDCTSYSFDRLPSSDMDTLASSQWMITSRGVQDVN